MDRENPDPTRYSKMTPAEKRTAKEFAKFVHDSIGAKLADMLSVWSEHDHLNPQAATNAIAVVLVKFAAMACRKGAVTYDTDPQRPFIDQFISENLREVTELAFQDEYDNYDPIQQMIDNGAPIQHGTPPLRAVN